VDILGTMQTRAAKVARLAAPITNSTAKLLYLGRPSAGKRTGRNIGEHPNTASDLEATHLPIAVEMRDFRTAPGSPPSLGTDGFELLSMEPVDVGTDGSVSEAALADHYRRVEQALCAATGACRVVVFDHTLRTSGVENLNSLDGKSVAGAVFRVHGDYTTASGPVRLQRLVDDGTVAGDRGITETDKYAFVNVWQSIDPHSPVLSHPLALCRPRSLDYRSGTWPYYMHYETRVGQNLAVGAEGCEAHEWGYYPRLQVDEAIVFIAFDYKACDGRVGVVHTAFEDCAIDGAGVPRRSIELRTVAFWDDS